jgi:O-antigen/teichoic acid export membrane protein
MIMCPLSLGLAAIAPTLVETFFDSKWASVGTMLTWLAALSIVRPLGSILQSYFYACNRPSVVLWLEWASLAGVVISIATLGRAGMNWVCASVGVVFALRTLASMWVVRIHDGVALSEFLVPMARPLVAGIAMAAGVTMTRVACAGMAPPQLLLFEISVGAAIYVAGVLLVARSTCSELVGAVRSALVAPA